LPSEGKLTFRDHSVVVGQVGGVVLVELLQVLELLHDHLQVLGVPHIAQQVAQVLQLLGRQLVVAAALLDELLEDVLECGGGVIGGHGGVGHSTTWTTSSTRNGTWLPRWRSWLARSHFKGGRRRGFDIHGVRQKYFNRQ